MVIMTEKVTKKLLADSLRAMGSEGKSWHVDIELPHEDGRAMRVGKLATGEYYQREQSANKKRPGSLTPLGAKEALAIRDEFDEVFAFRRKLAAGLMGSLSIRDKIQQNSDGILYAFAKTSRKEITSQYEIHYLLRINPDGEFFLTRDSDLYGTRAQEFPDASIETAYTYHVSPDTNHVGRVIYPTGNEVRLSYRRQDEPYTEYFEHVVANLKPFDITIAA